jgi:hypothetical protein
VEKSIAQRSQEMNWLVKIFNRMKEYEKTLLNHLQDDSLPDVPLAEVRAAMGHIGQTVGNPLTKTEIAITITLNFFDNVGNPIAPAALPANQQVNMPVYLFGLMDLMGGFLRNSVITAPLATWAFINSRIVGYQLAAPVYGIGVFGDLVLQYQEPVTLNRSLICVHCNNVAYGTFLHSFVSDLITISHIRFFTPNLNQFVNPIVFAYQTLFGKVSTDSIDPRLYILGKDPQQLICDLPVNLAIDKNLMISFYMDTFIPAINLVLFVEKVEALTHKNKRK